MDGRNIPEKNASFQLSSQAIERLNKGLLRPPTSYLNPSVDVLVRNASVSFRIGWTELFRKARFPQPF